MNQKILFTATSNIHIENFHLPYLEWFKKNGYEVHVACKGEIDASFIDVKHELDFGRSPFSRKNISTFLRLRKILKEHKFKLIHCHTPVASMLTRIASISSGGGFVFYTAHGFHFFKGAPLKNWVLYFPAEFLLSFFTDYLITINDEDYNRSKRYLFPRKGVFRTNGVGINKNRLKTPDKEEIRKLRDTVGIETSDVVFIYIAEMIQRKNHGDLIKACAILKKKNYKFKLLLLGGESFEGKRIRDMINALSLASNIIVLGYQKEINKYIALADVGVSASLQEGLPIGIAEVNLKGNPIIVSDIRGHREIVKHGYNGYHFKVHDIEQLASYMEQFIIDKSSISEMGINGIAAMQNFCMENVKKELIEIYSEAL